MEYNDYVIAFDENGTPYIAHAGFMDGARNAVNAAANRVQQVANNVKGVGRGVRQNHKYILKVNENGKTRYFYKQEEVKAYYEAKKRGIKNAAEYAQNAVKNKASEVADKAKQGVSNAKNAVREATGQAARDRMDAAAEKYPTLKQNLDKQNAILKEKEARTGSAASKYLNSVGSQVQADIKAKESNIFNRKARQANLESAKAQTEQYSKAYQNAKNEEQTQRKQRDEASKDYGLAEYQYNRNKAAYDKSLAGAVDRTAAKARDTASNAKEAASSAYNKAKDSANNAVKNAKDRFERMKGEFRDRAEQAGNAVKSTAKNAVDKAKDIAGYDEKERLDKATENKQSTKDAALKGEQYVTDVLNESPPGHRTQTQSQRLNAAVDVRNERWNAEDQARDEYWRARADYDKTPLAMVNRAKAQVSSAADSVRDKAEEAVEKLSSIPKAAKSAAEDVAFNVEYYSKQLKDGITGEKAAKAAANIREEVKDWKARADGVTNKELKDFYEQKANQAENLAKRFDEEAAKSVKGRINSATNSVQGMIDKAKKTAKDTAVSVQSTIDNATGNNYRKRAQEANQAAENAINQRARTSDQLENQRNKYGSKENDSDHIYGDSEGYYYKTKEQRDRAESLISKRDQYDADIVNNNRASKVNDSMYADSKAGKINSLLGRTNASTSERANSKASEVRNKWDRQEAESKLVGGRIESDTNVSKEYVYSRASNSGMVGQVSKVMKLEDAMHDAESAYDRLGNDASKPQSSSKAARQKMLQAQDAYKKAYEELIADINKQYDQDLAEYEKQYGKYNR